MSSRSSISILAQALAEKSGLKQADAEAFIRQMFDVASTSLETDKLLKIRWLGTFKVMTVKDRESIDVNTGERIVIGGREKISFTPDSILKEIVNKPFSQFETVVVNDGVDFSEIDHKFSSEVAAEEMDSIGDEDSVVVSATVESPSHVGGIDFTVDEELDVRNAADMIPTPASKDIVDYATDEVIVLPGCVVSEKHTSEKEDAADDKVKEIATGQKEEPTLVAEQPVLPETSEPEEHLPQSDVQPCPVLSSDKADTDIPAETATVVEVSGRDDGGQEEPEISSLEEEPHLAEEPHEEGKVSVTDETYDDTTDRKRYFSMPRWVIPVSAAALVALLVGIGWICFSYGKMKTERNLLASQLKVYETARQHSATKAKPRDIQADEIRRKSLEDSARMARASEAVAQAEKAEKKEADTEKSGTQTPSDKAKAGAKEVKDVSQKQPSAGQTAGKSAKSESTTKTTTKQEQEKSSDSQLSGNYDSDPRVRTGAYRIVGVAKTIEVKKGQTLQSLSRVYLGEGMECYVEAINGTRTLKPGQKLKIPQLQLKKKKAKKDA